VPEFGGILKIPQFFWHFFWQSSQKQRFFVATLESFR